MVREREGEREKENGARSFFNTRRRKKEKKKLFRLCSVSSVPQMFGAVAAEKKFPPCPDVLLSSQVFIS